MLAKLSSLSVLVVFIFGLSLNAGAENAKRPKKEMTPEMFANAKKKALEHINKRITILTEEKGCVEKASKREDMAKCRDGKRQAMQSLRESWKGNRERMRAMRRGKWGKGQKGSEEEAKKE